MKDNLAESRFNLIASHHIKAADTTAQIMWSVAASLVPVILAAVWYWGPSAMVLITAATGGALLIERLFGDSGSLGDGSAVITGILLGLTLPPGLPAWMAVGGGAFAIGFGKLIFGGLGQNVFNPALLGRAFLQAAFPEDFTTWPVPGGVWATLRGDNFALPLMAGDPADMVTGATPLGLMKFDQVGTDVGNLALGSTGGSLGETAAVVILAGGIYLASKNYLNWRIPVSIFLTVAVLAQILHLIDPVVFGDAFFMLFSGGLVLGAVYMATDMVTSPVTNQGCWVFGIGIGALVVLIRTWGGLAEGVMYSILLMNAMVPFIDRATQPPLFGTGRRVVAK